MAKKKKKAFQNSQAAVSPEKYIREKARTLPLGRCYINPDWQTEGLAHVIVSRLRPQGKLVIGDYLVDTFCLGVKDAFYTIDWQEDQLHDYLDRWHKVEEIPYEEAHNIIFGAISFAEDAGIEPHKDFNTAEYILEEDTEDIPLIDYEFGKDGKYVLMVGPDGKERVYINTLSQRLGDRFEFIAPPEDMDDYDFGYNDNDYDEEAEQYSYNHPEYPTTLDIKNEFIAEAFALKDNMNRLPDDIVNRIFSLPHDEAAADIKNIVMYEIGQTYKKIDNNTIEEDLRTSIMHSVIMLSGLNSAVGGGAVLEILRQNGEFADYHLGDVAPEFLPPALYACFKDNPQPVVDYIYTPGFESYMRTNALKFLTMIAIHQPERRSEIIEIFRQLLVSLAERLPDRDGCDGDFAGFVMSYLIDLNAKELIPEIKEVYVTGCVTNGITGNLDDVIEELEGRGERIANPDRYSIPSVDDMYKRLESWG